MLRGEGTGGQFHDEIHERMPASKLAVYSVAIAQRGEKLLGHGGEPTLAELRREASADQIMHMSAVRPHRWTRGGRSSLGRTAHGNHPDGRCVVSSRAARICIVA